MQERMWVERLRSRQSFVLLIALLGLFAISAPSARAASDDPLFVFSPEPLPHAPPTPPPNGYFNDPCGVTVDSSGRFFISDYYHDGVDVFTPQAGYVTRLGGLPGPCGIALDGSNRLYVNDYHRDVAKFGSAPTFAPAGTIDQDHPTGVAVDPATDRVIVDDRTGLSVFEPSGEPVLEAGKPFRIGAGTLGEGFGVAVSGFPGTAGRVYVPDAADDTLKAYDPSVDPEVPAETITGPPGGFSSLRDSAVAVDRVTGEIYVLDDLQPGVVEQPHALIDVFAADGHYEGHLKYEVVDGGPSGLAVDNSATATQGRVYVTSGNTHHGSVFAYPPGAGTTESPLRLSTPPEAPLGGMTVSPQITVGEAAHPGTSNGIACEGDECQGLPSEPFDPAPATLIPGLGNPAVKYHGSARSCRALTQHVRRLQQKVRRLRKRAADGPAAAGRSKRLLAQAERRAKRAARAVRRCRRAHNGGARSSAVAANAPQPAAADAAAKGADPAPASASNAAGLRGLLPGAAGFAAVVDPAEAEALAGSHPYDVRFGVGLDQTGGQQDLSEAHIQMPPGLLIDPAAPFLCTGTEFATPRSSPFEASEAGESCSDRSQVGTISAEAGSHAVRRFGVFNLPPEPGEAARFGASPFGFPVVFGVFIDDHGEGSYGFSLETEAIPAGLELHAFELSIWGSPWDASHNGERGNCLNELQPDFPWGKCTVGEPLDNQPLALLTLPTRCGENLVFAFSGESAGAASPFASSAVGTDSSGNPVLPAGCSTLNFKPTAEGALSNEHASSSSGFSFHLRTEDSGFANPRSRAASQPRRAVVQLPPGVTINPSVAVGLGTCTKRQYEAETAATPEGQGCPNAAKIGDFLVRLPIFAGQLHGSIYLAQPDDPGTSQPGAENPLDSLFAVYLIAKSADRGFAIKVPGELEPDEADGTVVAVFDQLPQLPYTSLEATFRSGQRAPLVTPSACGAAEVSIEITPQSGSPVRSGTQSPITGGTGNAPCPQGTPPFAPAVVAGGINSNMGSYTPYYVRLTRSDAEQEITSYSLKLPRGITGALSGIPFCPDAAIAAARAATGRAELASPSCPAASQVGRTVSGYGVGSSLAYAEGQIYLAGPYHGRPLSLVTVDPAVIGPFDLGTIVIRSAFSVDPHTAQLEIDSRASDPIPHILRGVPLHLRDVRIYLDRPNFVRNPTSCEPSQLVSTLTGAGNRFGDPGDDSEAIATERFQLLNCRALLFRPKLGMRLLGGTHRRAHPRLRVTVQPVPGQASLKDLEVNMPRSLFLALEHVRAVCTGAEFAADQCPASSEYGQAVVKSALFTEPLHGPVVLRSSSHRFPDLVVSLRSGEVRVVLEGEIGPSKSGGVRVVFREIPDAPIEAFAMELFGGKRGLLVNSVDICSHPPTATVKALGQNNQGRIFTTRLRGKCGRGRR